AAAGRASSGSCARPRPATTLISASPSCAPEPSDRHHSSGGRIPLDGPLGLLSELPLVSRAARVTPVRRQVGAMDDGRRPTMARNRRALTGVLAALVAALMLSFGSAAAAAPATS